VLQVLQAAIGRGDTSANLSQNPDESKLRWSEQIEQHNEFLLFSPRRRARLSTSLHLLQRSARTAVGLWR